MTKEDQTMRVAKRVARPGLVLGTATLAGSLMLLGACSGQSEDDPGTRPAATPSASSAPSAADELATTDDTAATGGTSCTTSEREPAEPTSSWSHPSQSYYSGSESDLPAAADLEHLLRADGAAVLRYRADALPPASMDALRTWAEQGVAVIALPAVDDTAQPVTVDVLDHTISCDGLDTVQLDAFVADRDFGDVDPH